MPPALQTNLSISHGGVDVHISYSQSTSCLVLVDHVLTRVYLAQGFQLRPQSKGKKHRRVARERERENKKKNGKKDKKQKREREEINKLTEGKKREMAR